MTNLLSSSFYALLWVFPGDTLFLLASMMTSHHFLVRPHLLSGESSNQRCSHPEILLRMHYTLRQDLLRPSFLIWPLKNKQLTFTKHTKHIIHHGSCIPGKCVQWMPHIISCSHLILMSLGTRIYGTNFVISFKMVDWMFEDALVAIQSPDSIPTSVLQSTGAASI